MMDWYWIVLILVVYIAIGIVVGAASLNKFDDEDYMLISFALGIVWPITLIGCVLLEAMMYIYNKMKGDEE